MKTKRIIINKKLSKNNEYLQYLNDALKVPKEIDACLSLFCKENSKKEPIFVDVRPEPWCRLLSCDLNVDKFLESNEGKKIVGYKIYYIEKAYIKAVRHSIYSDGNNLRDLTFENDGEERILFLPDDDLRCFYDGEDPIRKGIAKRAKKIANFLNKIKRPRWHLSGSWNKRITYKEWLEGIRQTDCGRRYHAQ